MPFYGKTPTEPEKITWFMDAASETTHAAVRDQCGADDLKGSLRCETIISLCNNQCFSKHPHFQLQTALGKSISNNGTFTGTFSTGQGKDVRRHCEHYQQHGHSAKEYKAKGSNYNGRGGGKGRGRGTQGKGGRKKSNGGKGKGGKGKGGKDKGKGRKQLGCCGYEPCGRCGHQARDCNKRKADLYGGEHEKNGKAQNATTAQQGGSTETDQNTNANRHVTFGQCPVLVNDDDGDDDAEGYDDFDADADNTGTNDTATNADTDSDSIVPSNSTPLPTPPAPNTEFSTPTDFTVRDNGFVMGPEAMAQFLEQEGMTYGTNDDHDQDAIISTNH
jgi:hypothetical protein